MGLSLGYSGYSFAMQDIERNILAGLRLSGYNLLISSLIMDFNILAAPYGLDFFHFDILAAYPLVKTRYYLLYVMAGMKFDINYREKLNDFGPSTALSLVFPLGKGLLFRLGAKAEYGLASDSFQPLFLSSLQFSF